MGGGNWTVDDYSRRLSAKTAAGKKVFDYDDMVRKTGVYKVHDSLDPKWVAGPGSPFAGKPIRESRDSDEHPESLPIAVFFDVTGSMGGIPRVLQTKLGKLYSLLLEKGYVEHPQILYGAIGDANTDRVPLQIGQFESDNRADENLENFFLEGGGGGQMQETYELGAYYMARHTATDAWEKRGRKGYLFFIGDERNYPTVSRLYVKSLIGVELGENISTREIYKELQEKWNVYFLYAQQGSYSEQLILGSTNDTEMTWRSLLNESALVLEDADAVCETIALTIGLGEGTIDLDEGLAHLAQIGTDSTTAAAVGKALAKVAGSSAPVAVASGSIPSDGDDGADRI